MKETIAAIERWMRENGAPRLAANLAKRASPAAIAAVERRTGLTFPAALRDLYRIHDGQPEELDCFIGSLNFLSMDAAAGDRETLLERYVRGRYGVLGYREEAEAWEQTELQEDEISERWWPIARMDGDFLVINLDSGRVFWAGKDVPPLRVAAGDLPSFFATYLRRLEAGAYRLEEGFGEYYLTSDEPWPAPKRPTRNSARPAGGTPGARAKRAFEETLGKNLFFLFDELTIAGDRATVVLDFHCPKSWLARLRAHPIVTEPLKRFTKAFEKAVPEKRCTVELLHVEVDLASLRLYLEHAGPAGTDLLRELG